MIIAQISDPHINEIAFDPQRAERAEAALRQAIAHLLRLPARPDAVLLTGDCVHTGAAAEYDRLGELLRELPIPLYAVPGNHDDRAGFLQLFGAQGAEPLAGFAQYAVDAGPLRLLALDTHIPGAGGGRLDAPRLAWLAERLAEAPDRPTIIFMHHPPFNTGLAPLDEIGLEGADEFGALVGRFPQVERIVAGHVHGHMQRRFHGTLAVTCPAVAHNLVPDFTHPARLDAVLEPPTLLLHVWSPAAGLVTHASLIGDHGPPAPLHDGRSWI
ncbi:MAG TPA: phosphodiesterase [Herpetosiphonaceae bacterium]